MNDALKKTCENVENTQASATAFNVNAKNFTKTERQTVYGKFEYNIAKSFRLQGVN